MKFLLSSLTALVLASCGMTTPRAASSKHLEMVTAGLAMKKGEAEKPFSFSAMADLLDGTPTPAYATFRFDNPEEPSKPFLVKASSKPAKAGTKSRPYLLAETPLFSRVGNYRHYSCSVDLFSDAARTRQIDHLEQKFQVALNPAMARALGVAGKLD